MASNPSKLQPMDEPKSGKGKLVATIGASAAALAIAFVGPWEGKSNDPYQDIVKVWTVCRGETHVEMRHYSDAECDDMFAASLAKHAAPVVQRNPELSGHPYQLAAAVSLAYNVGNANYSRSSIARLFSADKWRQACDGFLAWSYAGGKQVRGLLNRRRAEREMCLTGLAK